MDRGFLAPAGPVAGAIRHEFILVCLVMLLVIGPVLVLTPIDRLALPPCTHSAYRPSWSFSWSLEGLIWMPPR